MRSLLFFVVIHASEKSVNAYLAMWYSSSLSVNVALAKTHGALSTRLLHQFTGTVVHTPAPPLSPVRPPSPATAVRPLSKKPGPSSDRRSIHTVFSRISMTRPVRVWASRCRRSPRRFRCSAILTEHQQLCATRAAIEQQADQALCIHPDSQRLRTLPGVGPILALTILAEAGETYVASPTTASF